jgi:hypothetical protein
MNKNYLCIIFDYCNVTYVHVHYARFLRHALTSQIQKKSIKNHIGTDQNSNTNQN